MRRLLALILLLGLSYIAAAHDIRPMRLQLDEIAPGQILVNFKLPVLKDLAMPAAVVRFADDCARTAEFPARAGHESLVRSWQLACPNGLAGQTVRIDGFSIMAPDVLVTARFADGSETHAVLTASLPSAELIPEQTGHVSGLTAYFPLGIQHILRGLDHLLFVLGLLLVIWRIDAGLAVIFKTVTAFTLAHSVTLAGCTLLGWSLPSASVETLIALSVLLLAVEVARSRRLDTRPTGLSFRWPWLVAFAFGLLHGFGFADALQQVRLPEAARAWALLLFNLGVEAGQLLFVGMLLIIWEFLNRQLPRLTTPSVTAANWLLGILSAAWVLDRAGPAILF